MGFLSGQISAVLFVMDKRGTNFKSVLKRGKWIMFCPESCLGHHHLLQTNNQLLINLKSRLLVKKKNRPPVKIKHRLLDPIKTPPEEEENHQLHLKRTPLMHV